MTQRVLALLIACAAAAPGLPAYAQGLRASPQLGTVPRAPQATSGQRQADYIVAVVNSEPITNNEIRMRLVRVEQQLAQQGAAMPPRSELVNQVLERLIAERAQLQVAKETGVRVEESAIDGAEANVARQNQITVAELRRRLQADGMLVSQFRDDLRNQILIGRLREREVEPRVKVTDAEVDQFIREQQGTTDLSNIELNLSHILIAVPENAPAAQVAELKARATQVLARARAGEDFARLARETSQAPGAAQNAGVVGLRTADRYPPLFVQATQQLREGGISEVVQSGAGFHVIKVLEKRQGGMPGVNITQSHARHILVRPGPQLSESAARERLTDFRRRIQAGQADFATLARENSQDASAAQGGDLGWVNPGMFVPEFEDVMNGLAPGQIAEPLVSRFGVHLIQLIERREAKLSDREQREIARNLVREKKTEEAYVTWAQEVRGRAYVEVREPPQ